MRKTPKGKTATEMQIYPTNWNKAYKAEIFENDKTTGKIIKVYLKKEDWIEEMYTL